MIQKTGVEINGAKNGLLFRFENLREFHRAVQHAIDNKSDSKTYGRVAELIRRYEREKSFSGCYLNEAIERKYAYKGGLDKIMKMQGIEVQLKAAEYRKAWSEYDGDDMDMDRMYSEQPFLSRRVKVIGARNRGMFKIYINVAEPWMENYENMMWKTWAACRICDELENQGHRVEIMLCALCEACHPGYRYTLAEIVLKRFEEPFNIALLSTACSPWYFRIWLFILWSFYRRSNSHLGHPVQAARHYNVDDENKTAIIIDRGDCLSEERANNFIRTLDIGSEFDFS